MKIDTGSVMLQPIPGILVNVTHIIYLNIVTDQKHLLTAKVFPNGSRPFQQDNTVCQTAKLFRNGLENMTKCTSVDFDSKFPRLQSDTPFLGCVGQTV